MLIEARLVVFLNLVNHKKRLPSEWNLLQQIDCRWMISTARFAAAQLTFTQMGLYTIAHCESIHAFILPAQLQPKLVHDWNLSGLDLVRWGTIAFTHSTQQSQSYCQGEMAT